MIFVLVKDKGNNGTYVGIKAFEVSERLESMKYVASYIDKGWKHCTNIDDFNEHKTYSRVLLKIDGFLIDPTVISVDYHRHN